VASKAFGTEIFEVRGGNATININSDVMRLIWDNYYVPYISGSFYSYGRFRSDDTKVGDILMYIGSTSSASFFPTEVTVERSVYPITAKVLPVPFFEGIQNVMVQQGAGMVVTKGSKEEEYASVEFLKWFTDTHQNIEFAALTGYLPVKKEALDYDLLKAHLDDGDVDIAPIIYDTLKVALDKVNTIEMYTNKAFEGGTAARRVLETDLQEKAAADREAVVQMISDGTSREDAIAQFNTDDNFRQWMESLTIKLNEAAGS